jgi:hypothetical protein
MVQIWIFFAQEGVGTYPGHTWLLTRTELAALLPPVLKGKTNQHNLGMRVTSQYYVNLRTATPETIQASFDRVWTAAKSL